MRGEEEEEQGREGREKHQHPKKRGVRMPLLPKKDGKKKKHRLRERRGKATPPKKEQFSSARMRSTHTTSVSWQGAGYIAARYTHARDPQIVKLLGLELHPTLSPQPHSDIGRADMEHLSFGWTACARMKIAQNPISVSSHDVFRHHRKCNAARCVGWLSPRTRQALGCGWVAIYLMVGVRCVCGLCLCLFISLVLNVKLTFNLYCNFTLL